MGKYSEISKIRAEGRANSKTYCEAEAGNRSPRSAPWPAFCAAAGAAAAVRHQWRKGIAAMTMLRPPPCSSEGECAARRRPPSPLHPPAWPLRPIWPVRRVRVASVRVRWYLWIEMAASGGEATVLHDDASPTAVGGRWLVAPSIDPKAVSRSRRPPTGICTTPRSWTSTGGSGRRRLNRTALARGAHHTHQNLRHPKKP